VVTFQKSKDLYIIEGNAWNNTLNPVLCASVCWNFRTHHTLKFFSNQDPSFCTRLTPQAMCIGGHAQRIRSL